MQTKVIDDAVGFDADGSEQSDYRHCDGSGGAAGLFDSIDVELATALEELSDTRLNVCGIRDHLNSVIKQ